MYKDKTCNSTVKALRVLRVYYVKEGEIREGKRINQAFRKA